MGQNRTRMDKEYRIKKAGSFRPGFFVEHIIYSTGALSYSASKNRVFPPRQAASGGNVDGGLRFGFVRFVCCPLLIVGKFLMVHPLTERLDAVLRPLLTGQVAHIAVCASPCQHLCRCINPPLVDVG